MLIIIMAIIIIIIIIPMRLGGKDRPANASAPRTRAHSRTDWKQVLPWQYIYIYIYVYIHMYIYIYIYYKCTYV